ncbi:phostensin [Terrapene carolina triunguis]|uniref:Protein phosphatase 1 regulatory subunit 18 n=1 Tax=Terrapene triunguis TaxID=2587831 RepID=A0A674JAZ7_9SAUR|nr:phostensin [Terrapene carolina triunguis]
MASAPAPALPEWKLQLLERKRKEEEEARRREREQQDRMAKMPAWKREIIERRRAKQGSGTSFSDPEGSGGGAGPPLAVAGPPGPEMGQKESTVLQEKIGPVHQNPFIQLEKRRKETAAPEAEAASAKAKQLMELYGQRPGVRTLRADNVIIIESVPGAAPLGAERQGEAKSGSVESLNELLARRGGSVTEIRAGEVFIVKSALSRSVEDLNSFGQSRGEADCRPGLPEQRRGRVSKLLSRFGQEDPPPRPLRSLSTENLADGSYERPLAARKPPGSAQHRSGTPSPPRDLPGLTPSRHPFTVASYRSQFEARSEAWPESPPRRSPTGKAWGREAASPERGARHDGGSPGTMVPGPRSREANSPDRGAWHCGSTLAVVPGPQGTEATSPETGTRGDGSAMAPGQRGREAASPERGARPGGGALAVGPGLQAREAASPERGARPGGGALAVGPGLQAREAASPERGARLGGGALALGPGLQAREAASPERRDGGGGGSGAVILGPPGRDVTSLDRSGRGDNGDASASGLPVDTILDAEAQAKAVASLRLHSRNSFVVVPRRAAASPPPDPGEARQETSTSPPKAAAAPASTSSSSSPSREQLPLPASAEEPAEGEAMRRGGRGPRELGGPSTLPHPAVQRRSGNTITINPRKVPVPAVENGVEGEGGSAAPEKAASAPLKKRYPTAEEIQVIGGYLSLSKSCLAKNDPHRKKLKISFSESQLERTFQYPSEGSLLEEFGPPEESDAPACANPHGEDDEEEEELLLLHRGLPGVLRTKSLIVDESCRR